MKIKFLIIFLLIIVFLNSCKDIPNSEEKDCEDLKEDYGSNCTINQKPLNKSKTLRISQNVLKDIEMLWYESNKIRIEQALCLNISDVNTSSPFILDSQRANDIGSTATSESSNCYNKPSDGKIHPHFCSECCSLSENDTKIFAEAEKAAHGTPFFMGVICGPNEFRIYDNDTQVGYNWVQTF